MENASSSNNNMQSFPLSFFVDLLFHQSKSICADNTRKFFSRFWSSSLGHQHNFCNSKVLTEKKKNSDFEVTQQQQIGSSNEKKDDGNLSRGDVEMVMEKLGIFRSPEGEEVQEWFNSNEISGLFEENEPSLEEVKEAFDVFDENRDGFIDAGELQRVLCILGLNEGRELENCKTMIRKFDENGDGRVDFNEFVKFMENSF